MARYLSMFLFMTVGFAAVFAVVVGVLDGFADVLAPAAVSGVVFSAIITGLTWWSDLRNGGGRVRAEREALVPMPAEEAFERCLRALTELNGGTIIAADADTGGIEARTGISWQSFGEVVEVEIEPGVEGTRLRVRSAPRLKTTLVDYGKNRQNVDRVMRAVGGAGTAGGAGAAVG